MDAKRLKRLSAGKGLVASLAMFIMLFGFGSCSSSEDEPEEEFVAWDIAPIEVKVKIVDNSGANLLDETVDGNWVGQPFELTYEGETYNIKWPSYLFDAEDSDAPSGRACMPIFFGFEAHGASYWNGKQWIYPKGQYILSFGQFDGADDQDLSVQLKVPGMDQVYNIAVKHRGWYEKGELRLSTEYMLNGERVEKFPMEIVLPRLSKQE